MRMHLTNVNQITYTAAAPGSVLKYWGEAARNATERSPTAFQETVFQTKSGSTAAIVQSNGKAGTQGVILQRTEILIYPTGTTTTENYSYDWSKKRSDKWADNKEVGLFNKNKEKQHCIEKYVRSTLCKQTPCKRGLLCCPRTGGAQPATNSLDMCQK